MHPSLDEVVCKICFLHFCHIIDNILLLCNDGCLVMGEGIIEKISEILEGIEPVRYRPPLKRWPDALTIDLQELLVS